MNGWQYYGLPHLQVVPYMPGTPVFRDGMLPYLYTCTKEEGKIKDVFCGDFLGMDSFVTFFDKRKTMQVLAEVEENKNLKPVGYSWVDSPRGVDGARAAFCGFCFFNNASKRSSARDLARLAVAYALIDLKIDVLHGVQVESNLAARNFSRRLGFREVATVPFYHSVDGQLVGARVMTLEKKDFLPKFEEWFNAQKAVESIP